jgi:hypothetical protein
MLALVIAGGANLFGVASSSITQLIPRPFLMVWSGVMFLGGMLALVAAWWPDRITGLLLERTALTAVSLSLFIYAGGVAYIAGRTGAVAICLTLFLGVAAAWRILHINRELAVLHRFIAWAYEGEGDSP